MVPAGSVTESPENLLGKSYIRHRI